MERPLVPGWLRWRSAKRVTTLAAFEPLAQALLSGKGEASGVSLAATLLESYAGLSEAGQVDFFRMLSTRFGPDLAALKLALAAVETGRDAKALEALHTAAEPRRQELIRRMNMAPGGTHRLVQMRMQLLRAIKTDPSLAAVDADFRHLFSSWFNRGFLVLRRIDWSTPADILEKIIQYEAVHAIKSWDDLRRRLEPQDRRCFAFFHPALSGEPLIFVEVALTQEIPSAIAPLLADARVAVSTARANTAVFYSISNCQAGLRGVSFGNFLIKQVAEDLRQQLPGLDTFVTLSPMPGFGRWLTAMRASKGKALPAADRVTLAEMDLEKWHEHPSRGLREAMSRAAVTYLFSAKDGSGKPLDPVARFHLGNGARLERLNWLGDVSDKGLTEGAGFMVNYLYDLPSVESNHEAFANEGAIVASAAMRRAFRRLSA